MKTVTIKYRPFFFFPFRTITASYPQNWGDITPAQLIAIACVYKNRITDLEFLKTMTGIPKRILKRCTDYERYKLMELFEFIGDRKPYHDFIIKKLQLKSPMLHAPSPKLKGITFGQFIFADTYFSNYQESQNEEDLNKFIAALYLRINESFSEKSIQDNYKSIGRIDRTIREAIAINYQLIHEWLSLAYPLIFQKHEEESRDRACPVQETPPAHDPNTWIKIFQNFVGDDILHDDVWASKPINTIFQYMTRKYKENARKKN